MRPFLTFYTPTFQRPEGLARCVASVAGQTLAAEIEQIIVPDFLGRGVGGMYGEVANYVDAVHGQYVHLLSDDEVLADPTVVAELKAFAEREQSPPAICVRVAYQQFGILPDASIDPPLLGHIGLSCLVTRADVWREVTLAGGWGQRYEGDYDFALAVHAAGYRWRLADIIFTRASCHRGLPELAYAR